MTDDCAGHVRPGHPYLTRELAEQRSRQRRFLRSIPTALFRSAGTFPQPTLPVGQPTVIPTDAPMLEATLRCEAERLLDDDDSSLRAALEGSGDHEALDLAARYLTHAAAGAHTPAQDLRFGGPLEYVAEDLRRRSNETRPETIPAQHRQGLSAVVGLLVLADALADDGYSDPRIFLTA